MADWPWLNNPPVLRVAAAVGEVRYVGGCVRDTLAGRPVHDIDLATPLPPAEVMRRLRAAGIKAIPTGIAHGTVTAVADAVPVEITTLRHDLNCDGRHAEVAFTEDWVADAARRDFTMNALSCAPDGTLFDPFGGREDLRAGRVRFVGRAEDRIGEDVLRLLRWFRFHAHYGRPPPDPEALAACRALAPRLPGLSGERVRAEVLRLLAAPSCPAVWHLMAETGVVAQIAPAARRTDRLAALVALEQALGLAGGGPAEESRALVRLAATLDTDRAGALALAGRLRLSRAERERLARLVAPPVRFDPGQAEPALARGLLRLGAADLFLDLLLLAAADAALPAGQAPAALAPARTLARRWQATPFPLAGRDLQERGVAAGPGLGRLLAGLQDWWAEGLFLADRPACLAELERRRLAGNGMREP